MALSARIQRERQTASAPTSAAISPNTSSRSATAWIFDSRALTYSSRWSPLSGSASLVLRSP
jgi:hypothetical protein